MTFNLLIPARRRKKNTLWEYYFFFVPNTGNIRCLHSSRTFLQKSIQVTLFFSESWRWMDTCEPSRCHDHQQQQRYRDRLPSGDSALPKQISSSKNCWGPNPLITSTWNQIMVPESAARYNWCTWNKPRSSLLHPPPPPSSSSSIISLEHLYRGIHSQERRERNVKTRETWLILPPWPFRFPFYHSLHSSSSSSFIPPPHCLFSLFILSSTLWGASSPSEPRQCVKQSRRDEKQRCCTRNSETPEKMDFNYSATAGAEWDISCCIKNRLLAFKNKNDLNFLRFEVAVIFTVADVNVVPQTFRQV